MLGVDYQWTEIHANTQGQQLALVCCEKPKASARKIDIYKKNIRLHMMVSEDERTQLADT